ncbi:MAG: efflux transporter, family, subunit [Sphingobacteriales bacterium]|nr:efflux transporter, family, subunit [Sphingobacteriales bacterium]
MKYIQIISVLLLPLLFASCTRNKNKAQENQTSTEHIHNDVYTCPMHPQIKRDKPGDCPICGMALVKQGASTTVKTQDSVSLGTLLKPTNSYVISSIPVISPTYGSEQITIEALGTAAYNTQYNGTISAKISGRIEKLYMRYNFQDVMKGQKVMDIYSPELLTAQQNLLYVVRNDAANQSLIQASKERLRLLGLSQANINQLIRTGKTVFSAPLYSNYNGHIHEIEKNESNVVMPSNQGMQQFSIKEGMYINAGQVLFSVYNPNHLWALIQINPKQQKFVKKGTPVQIYSEVKPQRAITGFINFIEPIIREENKTITARVNFDNEHPHIPVGSQLKATLSINTPSTSWLPSDAVVFLGNSQIVLLKDRDGFKVQRVETGIKTSSKIEIIKGLSATDLVAQNGQYLMDSESFIKVKQ